MKLFRLVFKDRSLWFKFSLLSIVPVLVVMLCLVFFLLNSLERSMVEKTKIRASGLTKLSVLSMSNTFVIYNKDLLDNFVDSLNKEKDIVFAMVVDSNDNRILAHSDHQNDGKIFKESLNHGDPASNQENIIVSGKKGKINIFSAPIRIDNDIYGRVILGFSLEEVQYEIMLMKKQVSTIAAITIIIGVCFSILLARLLSTPIMALAEQAKNIGQGNFDQKIIYESQDALGQLANSFNKMAQDLKLNVNMLKQGEAKIKAYSENLEEIVKKRTAELEIAKDQAESSDRVKSAFLASMSHELRTPLNSIIGFTGIILNELVGPLNFEQKKELTMVKASANHLLSLINDVLDISKIEAGEAAVSWTSFNLQGVVEQVVKEMTPLVEKKGLTLSKEIDPEVGEITSDERRIRQVVINLINNAAKFTIQGEVKLSCKKDIDRIKLSVTDTGIGIKAKDMVNLFKPFRQIDTGTTRKYEGTGLGLSISKRILDLLGGSIEAKSSYGEGSTFTVYLPVIKKGEQDEK